MAHLSRNEILAALDMLSNKLLLRGGRAELALMGGAAMVLRYAAREATKDVDAVFLTPESREVRELAIEVARELAWREEWLNDGAKGFVQGLSLGDTVFQSASLLVRVLAPEQLLAMKLSAWRDDQDIADARRLMCEFTEDREYIWRKVAPHLVPGREQKAAYAYDDLWETRT